MRSLLMNYIHGLILCLCVILPCELSQAQTETPRQTGPWKLDELTKVPAAEWGDKQGLLQTVYYAGESYKGQPTRVFAYVGRPAEGAGPFPAMVLVHGGGGKAFPAWAEHWAKRGYVAIAMDLAGHGPDGPLPDGGPSQSDDVKFGDFTPETASEMWSYHAVAAVLRAHSLIASLPEVDREKIGVTGISWGGYLTCIVAGIDPRLKVAVPVYGCGYLWENSAWVPGRFSKMTPEQRDQWVKFFDPSQYLPGVTCPILFLNGTNDFAYPMDSYLKSYSLVKSPVTVSVQVRLPHGHIWTFPEVDAFVDSHLRDAPALPKVEMIRIAADEGLATASVEAPQTLSGATLNFTTDTGEWQKRNWQSQPAEVREGKIIAPIPPGRPIVFYLVVTEADRKVTVSTPQVTLGQP